MEHRTVNALLRELRELAEEKKGKEWAQLFQALDRTIVLYGDYPDSWNRLSGWPEPVRLGL